MAQVRGYRSWGMKNTSGYMESSVFATAIGTQIFSSRRGRQAKYGLCGQRLHTSCRGV